MQSPLSYCKTIPRPQEEKSPVPGKNKPFHLTLIDPAAEVTVSEDWLQSRSKNSAWLGQTLTGAACDVFVAGRHTLTDGEVTPVRRVLR